MSAIETRRRGWPRQKHVAVLEFDAEELRNVAYALGLHDSGALEMLKFADELDAMNGVDLA